jgi:hypothetical protein
MSSLKLVVGDPEPKKHGFPPTIRGNDKRGQACPEPWAYRRIEGLLLCIKTKKIERRLIQMREKLIKILSPKYLTSTAMASETFGSCYGTLRLAAGSFIL